MATVVVGCLPQPTDVGRFQAHYTEWLISGYQSLASINKVKRASLQDFAGWVRDAWYTTLSGNVLKPSRSEIFQMSWIALGMRCFGLSGSIRRSPTMAMNDDNFSSKMA